MLLLHFQGSDEELTGADGAPADGHACHQVAQQAGEGEEHAYAGEADEGEEAVADDRDDTDEGDAGYRHQVEEGIHGQTT